jgi:hypothetical protein
MKRMDSGPESIPLMNPVTDFPLTVRVFNDNDEMIKEDTIQYANPQHRKWLGKITYWACSNGLTVETCKATEEEALKLR